MPKRIITTEPATEWGKYLLGARMATVDKNKGEGQWPLSREAFVQRINLHLVEAPVTEWAYMRWEMGTRTPKEKRQKEVRKAIKKAKLG